MAPLDEVETVDSKCCSNVFPSPFWGSGFVPSGTQFFVEVFAGEAGLTQAIIARGIKTLPLLRSWPTILSSKRLIFWIPRFFNICAS